MSVAESAAEAQRTMTVCNACRYCEGLCATFQAMSLKRTFTDNDLDYLANLCHNCTTCFHGCQYASPHEFDINVPRTLSAQRVDSWTRYAWPRFLARLFERNGLVTTLATAVSLAVVFLFALQQPVALSDTHGGNFYAVISHEVMVAVGSITFGFSLVAILVSARRFIRAIGTDGRTMHSRSLMSVMHDVATLRQLSGGAGEGCSTEDDRLSNSRRWFHQLTMWGFLLCFAATCVATIYHYVLGLPAPYPVMSWPVMLGTLGGIGLLIGPAGLWSIKRKMDPRPAHLQQYGMDYAFIAMLFLISLTGMLLLVLRDTQAMGALLAIHLGFVLAFFLTLPYSKFVHGAYRFIALLKFSAEERR